MLENYETVAERLAKFWAKYPNGAILTEMVKYDGDIVIFRAECYFDRTDSRPAGTGYAEERYGTSMVNKSSFVENAESSAVGRCLANGSFASHDPALRPSREEMAKVQRQTTSNPGHANTEIRVMSGNASDKQIGYIKGACKRAGIVPPTWLESLTKQDASAFIEAEKNGEPVAAIIARMSEEEPF